MHTRDKPQDVFLVTQRWNASYCIIKAKARVQPSKSKGITAPLKACYGYRSAVQLTSRQQEIHGFILLTERWLCVCEWEIAGVRGEKSREKEQERK